MPHGPEEKFLCAHMSSRQVGRCVFNVITVSSSSLSGVGPTEMMSRVMPLDKVSLVDTDSSVSYFAKKKEQLK